MLAAVAGVAGSHLSREQVGILVFQRLFFSSVLFLPCRERKGSLLCSSGGRCRWRQARAEEVLTAQKTRAGAASFVACPLPLPCFRHLLPSHDLHTHTLITARVV